MNDKMIIGVDIASDGDFSAVTFAHFCYGVLIVDDVEVGRGPDFEAFLEYVLPPNASPDTPA